MTILDAALPSDHHIDDFRLAPGSGNDSINQLPDNLLVVGRERWRFVPEAGDGYYLHPKTTLFLCWAEGLVARVGLTDLGHFRLSPDAIGGRISPQFGRLPLRAWV